MNMDRSDERPTPAPLPEELWSGSFGDEYVERNAQLDDRRRGFWTGILDEFAPASVLEVGCGQGGSISCPFLKESLACPTGVGYRHQ